MNQSSWSTRGKVVLAACLDVVGVVVGLQLADSSRRQHEAGHSPPPGCLPQEVLLQVSNICGPHPQGRHLQEQSCFRPFSQAQFCFCFQAASVQQAGHVLKLRPGCCGKEKSLVRLQSQFALTQCLWAIFRSSGMQTMVHLARSMMIVRTMSQQPCPLQPLQQQLPESCSVWLQCQHVQSPATYWPWCRSPFLSSNAVWLA